MAAVPQAQARNRSDSQTPPIQGYVITVFTDLNWEANGLIDMWRNPKVYAERLAAIQQEDVLLPSTPTTQLHDG